MNCSPGTLNLHQSNFLSSNLIKRFFFPESIFTLRRLHFVYIRLLAFYIPLWCLYYYAILFYHYALWLCVYLSGYVYGMALNYKTKSVFIKVGRFLERLNWKVYEFYQKGVFRSLEKIRQGSIDFKDIDCLWKLEKMECYGFWKCKFFIIDYYGIFNFCNHVCVLNF